MFNNMMMKNMMQGISKMLPPAQTPDNAVSQFIEDEIAKIAPEDEIIGTVSGIVVGMANNDPNAALKMLVTLHNDIGDFVNSLQGNEDADQV